MKDKVVESAFLEFRGEVDQLRVGKGYQVADVVRNKFANHYDIKFVMSSISTMPDDTDCSLYLTEQNGNSCYPMGEHVVFAGVMSDGRKSHAIQTESDLDEWVNWTSSVVNLLNRLHARLFEVLLDEGKLTPTGRTKNIYLDKDLVGDLGVDRLPLYFWSHG